jgi:hypothetical protein
MSMDSIMRAAVTKKRSEGSPSATAFYAYVPEIAHVAFADGRSPEAALAALRQQVSGNFPRALAAWRTLGPKQFSNP